jgi:fermentation-respiration switch protein FrsA (DUF1100 family)
MKERSLTFTSGEQQLAGTLCTPGGSDPTPAVLLLSGSGPLDRDGNHRQLPLGVSRQLAWALADRGVTTLRYDKRGVGGSSGDWRAAGLTDNMADAEAALEMLSSRREVRRGAVFVAGHSEGAVLAGAVAAHRPGLAGVVLLCAAARPGEQVLLWQAAQIVPGLPLPARTIVRLLRVDPVAKVAASHSKVKATTTDVVRMAGARVNARWFREYFAHDPSADLRRVRSPVLAVSGTKDLEVPPEDLEAIAAAAGGPVETHLVNGLTHTVRIQRAAPSLRLYRSEARRPVAAEVLTLVTDWVIEHSRQTHPTLDGD